MSGYTGPLGWMDAETHTDHAANLRVLALKIHDGEPARDDVLAAVVVERDGLADTIRRTHDILKGIA